VQDVFVCQELPYSFRSGSTTTRLDVFTQLLPALASYFILDDSSTAERRPNAGGIASASLAAHRSRRGTGTSEHGYSGQEMQFLSWPAH